MKKKTSKSQKSNSKKTSAKKAAVSTRAPKGTKDKKTKETWPLERNVLFRPERVGYVRKLIPNDGCVFCSAAKNPPNVETLTIYQSTWSMIVLNKFPYNSGHLLVLPRRHIGNMLELSPNEYEDLMFTVRKAVEAVETIYAPPGFNMGLNHGAVSGAGIPDHLHFHLIPRWAGDLNFFPLIAQTKVVIESLEETYEKYFNHFNGKK